jgi:CysZ protein
MIQSAFRAMGDVLSPEFRGILFKALGLTLAIFIAVFIGFHMLMRSLTLVKWGWADTIIDVAAGLGLVVAFFFLMAPVTALFAGLFLDRVAAIVEARHYPEDAPGTALSGFTAITTALSFGLVVLLVNIAILPTLFFGIGAFAIIGANAYLLSREYFEMVAMRHMPVEDARLLRKANSPQVLFAGLVPAILAAVPIVNLAVPLFSTSYFIHIFKGIKSSSP